MAARAETVLMLRPGVSAIVDRARAQIVLVGDRCWRLRTRDLDQLEGALALLREGARRVDLAAVLGERRAGELVGALEAHGMLRAAVDLGSDERDGAQARQVAVLADRFDDAAAAMDRLRRARVAIVGCGGTGGVALQHLVGAGVRRFVLVDHDVVELSNLNRQFVPELASIGAPKTSVAAGYVHRRVRDADVVTVERRIARASDLADVLGDGAVDLVLGCADTPPVVVERAIVEACVAAGVPCTFSGVAVRVGTVGPLLADRASALAYLAHLRALEPVAAALRPTPASIGTTNTLIATLMTHDVVQFLAGELDVPTRATQWRYTFADHDYRPVRRW